MIKWTQKLQDYWKANCSNNDFELPANANDAILAFIGQIEYLNHLIADGSQTQPVTEKSDKILKQLADLKNKIEILEKRISALEPKESPTAIFYKNGKPVKKKAAT